MGEQPTDLISVPEAAKRAGVAANTMRLAARNGKIKAIKPGRDWLIDAGDIVRWKSEHYRPDMAHRYPVDADDDEEDTDNGEP